MDVIAKAMTRARDNGRAWRLVAALVILAFSFQSYLAQTHIHKPAAAISANLVHHAGPDGAPVGGAPLDCPFCQVVNHAGSFLVCAVPILLVAAQWAEMAAPRHLLADMNALARHHWRSRAPPSP